MKPTTRISRILSPMEATRMISRRATREEGDPSTSLTGRPRNDWEYGSAMGKKDESRCHFCDDPLDAGSEFVFLVEAQTYDEEVAPFDLAELLPYYQGEPLRLCKECRASIEQNRQDLLERAAEEEASSRGLRRVLSIVGIVLILIVVAIIVADSRR
jgi:hypothetical protein